VGKRLYGMLELQQPRRDASRRTIPDYVKDVVKVIHDRFHAL
jgi:hypothetical protein